MELLNEFKVPVPIEKAWEALTDLKAIAPCLPGAELVRVKNGEYEGTIKVKVGPIVSTYSGVATWVDRNHKTYTAILKADGKESKGTGSAAAVVHAVLKPIITDDGNVTKVSVTTNLSISGKIAQLGRGLLDDVSGKLLEIFASNLSNLLSGKPIDSSAGYIDESEINASLDSAGESEVQRDVDSINGAEGADKTANVKSETDFRAGTEQVDAIKYEATFSQQINSEVSEDSAGEPDSKLVPQIDVNDDNENLIEFKAVNSEEESKVDLSDSLKERLDMVRRDIDDARKGMGLEASLANEDLEFKTEKNEDASLVKGDGDISFSPKVHDQGLAFSEKGLQDTGSVVDRVSDSNDAVAIDKFSKLANDIDLNSEIEQAQLSHPQNDVGVSSTEVSPVDDKLSKLANSTTVENESADGNEIFDFQMTELDSGEAREELEVLNSVAFEPEDFVVNEQILQEFGAPTDFETDNTFREVDDLSSLPEDSPDGSESENIVELQVPEFDNENSDSANQTNGEVISIFKDTPTGEITKPPVTTSSGNEIDISDNQSLASIIEMPVSSNDLGSPNSISSFDKIGDGKGDEENQDSSSDSEFQRIPNEPIDILDLVGSPLKNRLKPLVVPSLGVLLLLIIRHILKSKNPDVD